jgi:tetratricopeptide (TPR) repeat protein
MSATTDVDAVLKQARRTFRKGEFAEALQLFEQALAMDEKRPDVHMGAATAFFLTKNYDKAIEHFNRVTQLAPHDGKSLINLGAVYNQMGEYQKAVGVLRRGLQKEKKSAEGFYNLGYAHRKLEQAAMAVSAYREAVRLKPDMVEAHVNLANVFHDMNNNQQAIIHYKKALELNPNFASAQSGLAAAEQASQQAKKAISPFGRLVEHGALRPRSAPGSERKLNDTERIEDRTRIHVLSGEIDVAAKQLLHHLRETLDKSIATLNRSVTQGDEAPSVLVKAFDHFSQASDTASDLRRTFKRKLLELRAHEELMNTPGAQDLAE